MDIEEINKKIIDYPVSLRDLLDHFCLMFWFEYMGHRAGTVPSKNINFDGRPFIELPSGRKVRIIITVEDITEDVRIMDVVMVNQMIHYLENRKKHVEKELESYYLKRVSNGLL